MKTLIRSFILTLALCGQSSAQTASLLPPALQQFLDNDGNPLSSGTVDFYIPNTSTRKNTWSDSTETTVNTNPVVLDAAGRPNGGKQIYGDGQYRQVLKDSLGNTIWDKVTSSTLGPGQALLVGDGQLVGTIKPWAGIVAPSQYAFAYGQELARSTYSVLMTAITITSTVTCASGSPIITSVPDTSQIPLNSVAAIELACVPAGTKVVGKTSTSLTLSNNSNINSNSTAVIFPYGNGNGTTTFNVPDLRGLVIAGRNNMGGSSGSNLTSAYYGITPNATGALGGAQSSTLVQANLPALTLATSIAAGQGSHTHTFSQPIGTSNTVGTGSAVAYINSAGLTINSATLPSMTGTTPTGGSSTPLSLVQPTFTLNYLIKVLPDLNASVANGVDSIQGMTGALTCGANMLCTGNVISSGISSSNGVYIATGMVDGVTTSTTNLSITSGQSILTSSTSIFTASMVSNLVVIPAAGAAGVPLVTTIASFQSATQVTLTSTASSTLAAANHTITIAPDNTSALQASITTAISLNAILMLPASTSGKYGILGPLTIPSSALTIRGQGLGVTQLYLMSATTDLFDIADDFSVNMSDFTMVAPSDFGSGVTNNAISTAGAFINITSSNPGVTFNADSSFDRVRFNYGWNGINTVNASLWHINRSFFYQTNNIGISIANAANPDSGDSDVTNTEFQGSGSNTNGGSGIAIFQQNSGGLRFVSNKINNWKQGYQAIRGGGSVATGTLLISSNSFESSVANGVAISFAKGTSTTFNTISIIGNEIAFANGIDDDNSGGSWLIDLSITGNNIYTETATGIGVRLRSATRFTITDNVFDQAIAGGTGIIIGSAASNGVISNNILSNMTTALTSASLSVNVSNNPGYNGSGVVSRFYVIARGINFNAANTDNSISIPLPVGVTNYLVVAARISNASASISTATAGLFTAAAGGGTNLLSSGVMTVTTASANTNNNTGLLSFTNATTQSFNLSTLYFRTLTAEGSPATADVFLEIAPL